MNKTLLIWVSLMIGYFINANSANAQNVNINILVPDEGKVALGAITYLEVYIANTNAASSVAVYKLRPLINVPELVHIPATGHVLPDGWAIVFNDGQNLKLSNGTDVIPPNEARKILIALEAVTTGGPSTINANMQFSNGVSPGTAFGPPTVGNILGDDNSNGAIEVVELLPIKISEFFASAYNCTAKLSWVTQAEQNSDHFEIERYNTTKSDWDNIGSVQAAGFTSNETNYSFIDASMSAIGGKNAVYRIKMVDKNGAYKYSKTLPVNTDCGLLNVTIYPNPVEHGKLKVGISGADKKCEVSLTSITGQLLLRQQVVDGTNIINTDKLPNGMYQLKVMYADKLFRTEPVQIQH